MYRQRSAVSFLHFILFITVSLDRGRDKFENEERELMHEVRRLREKLAVESRNKKPPRHYDVS